MEGTEGNATGYLSACSRLAGGEALVRRYLITFCSPPLAAHIRAVRFCWSLCSSFALARSKVFTDLTFPLTQAWIVASGGARQDTVLGGTNAPQNSPK